MRQDSLRLLKFAIRFPDTWHMFGTDVPTKRSLRELSRMGLIVVDQEARKFHLNTFVKND